nr:MAG TPA: hypothetical protein [Crassvirales sp.]
MCLNYFQLNKQLNKMNKFKFIIKGILLWTTGFVTILFVVGVDSIYDNGYFFQTLIAVVVMIFCCYKLISEEEFEVLSLYRWFNKIIGEESCGQ